ncbi:MAG: protein-L-isoaspartate(D-aspartate) O-methyltransferase [Myxococcota bacterium]
MFDFELEEMIQQQLVSRGIEDQRVIQAFRRIPRREFVPDYLHNRMYHDEQLPMGLGQTISPPYMVARMLQDLAMPEEARVLEVGTGSGYQTSLLAVVAGTVHTVEMMPELSARARKMLVEDMGLHNVSFRVADGFQGWSDAAPFDAIVVNAAADEIPWPLEGQLRPGGRLVMPVGTEKDQELQVVERSADASSTKVIRTEPIPHPFALLSGEAQEF